MVRGLEKFRERFKDFSHCYVLIGGTACDLALAEAGVEFRATKDLDIVLCIEAIDEGFVRAFWEFVKAGAYATQESSSGEKKFYRFKKPVTDGYPEMLELFSRAPDVMKPAAGSVLTPIPVDADVESLSAILLEGNYYGWVHAGKREIAGLPIVRPEHLIPLKCKAWLDFRKREAAGEQVDSKTIRKHRNDVFRLYAVVDPDFRVVLPDGIDGDMRTFFSEIMSESIDLKSFGLGGLELKGVVEVMKKMYGV